MYGKPYAVITFENPHRKHLVGLNECKIFEIMYREVEDRLGDNDIPIAQEVSAWAVIASVGEHYDGEGFTVDILCEEK